jgi:hypothetical protein
MEQMNETNNADAKRVKQQPAEHRWVKPTVKLNTKCSFSTIWMMGIAVMALEISLLTLLNYNNDKIIEYYGLDPHVCRGGMGMSTEYSITPTIFNSTLLYYPASLQFKTIATSTVDNFGSANAVDLTFPTPAYRYIKCDSYHTRKHRPAHELCDYMVGELITKYEEFRQLDNFTCYIKDGQVVSLAEEYNSYVVSGYYYLNISYSVITLSLAYLIWLVIRNLDFQPSVSASRTHA